MTLSPLSAFPRSSLPEGSPSSMRPNGRFRISLTQAQTTALSFNEAIYDLEAVPPAR